MAIARSGCANFVLGSRKVKVSMRPKKHPAWLIKTGPDAEKLGTALIDEAKLSMLVAAAVFRVAIP